MVLILLIATSISTYGQKLRAPKYFLNSKEFVHEKVYINPMSIDSIIVNKESKNGEIYFYTKSNNLTFLPLEDVLKEFTYIESLDNSILFRINDDYLNDIEGILIDNSYFIYVDVMDVSNAQYLSDDYRDLRIVEIDLEKEERKPIIFIRGDQDIKRYLKYWKNSGFFIHIFINKTINSKLEYIA